jgi:hypothetical protein
MSQINIKYAIGYGAGGRFSKVPDEKTISVSLEDLNIKPDDDDDKIRDAVWEAILGDITRNANLDDVLAEDFESVLMVIHEAMDEQHSRQQVARRAPRKRRAR